MYLVYDTETTGLPNWRMGPHEAQPGLVQFAAILYDTEWNERSVVSLIVKPRSFITSKAQDTHGISQEMADRLGVSEAMAVAVWDRMCEPATEIIAHNDDFDWLIMESARMIHRVDRRGARPEKRRCTCKGSTDVVRLPPTDRMIKAGHGEKFKMPSLMEAHKFCFDGEGFDGAHDALIDVRACGRVFRHLREKGLM